MNKEDLKLHPFQPPLKKEGEARAERENLPEVWVEVIHRKPLVEIRYTVKDESSQIIWPQSCPGSPGRKDQLWLKTCFEFFYFLTDQKGESSYREWNCSTNQDWQAYDFKNYRTPEVLAPTKLTDDDAPTINFEKTELVVILPAPSLIEATLVNISAILFLKDGSSFAYALKHPGPQADFHHRDGFTPLKNLLRTKDEV